MLSKAERLELILESLARSETPLSIEDSVQLINRTVERIEDKFSGVPKVQNPGKKFDGRMYGIQSDSLTSCKGGMIARTRGNYIYFWFQGGFDILDIEGRLMAFNHPQRSGRVARDEQNEHVEST